MIAVGIVMAFTLFSIISLIKNRNKKRKNYLNKRHLIYSLILLALYGVLIFLDIEAGENNIFRNINESYENIKYILVFLFALGVFIELIIVLVSKFSFQKIMHYSNKIMYKYLVCTALILGCLLTYMTYKAFYSPSRQEILFIKNEEIYEEFRLYINENFDGKRGNSYTYYLSFNTVYVKQENGEKEPYDDKKLADLFKNLQKVSFITEFKVFKNGDIGLFVTKDKGYSIHYLYDDALREEYLDYPVVRDLGDGWLYEIAAYSYGGYLSEWNHIQENR